jgi:hypothetical protein
VSLEELADTKEYVISFPQANAQKDTKDLTASKPSTDKKDANGQPDKTPKKTLTRTTSNSLLVLH